MKQQGELAHLGTLLIEMSIPGSQSLKDKRRILKSLKERIRKRFNVSVAEIAFLDKWQRSLCGVAVIGNDPQVLNSTISQVFDFISAEPSLAVIDSRIELL